MDPKSQGYSLFQGFNGIRILCSKDPRMDHVSLLRSGSLVGAEEGKPSRKDSFAPPPPSSSPLMMTETPEQ